MASIVTPRKAPAAGRTAVSSPWRFVDVSLVASVLAVSGLGALMVFSATRRKLQFSGASQYQYLEKQLFFIVVGFIVMVAVTLIDYENIRGFAHIIYGAVVGALILLIPLGLKSNGAQSWFPVGPFQIQPSEYAKLATIIGVSSYVAHQRGEIDLRRFAMILGIAGVPLGLIYLQPDLGTALVVGVIVFALLLVAGARARHMVALTLGLVVAVAIVLQLGVLQQYQVSRLTAFLDSNSSVSTKSNSKGSVADQQALQRAQYNLRESKIAIGSGGTSGKGLFKGTQTNLSYVPEQQTDFIFTVVGEELGFVGSATLLALFGIIAWRIWRTAILSRDQFGTLLCVGVLAMIIFQIFENMGMAMGIMPITGIPLPFMSYGGSATIAEFIGIGLVLNVHMRRFR